MRRREFITLLGGAVMTWPFSAHAQQAAMPVIGFLGQPTADAYASRVAAYRQALKESGFVEGKNVRIEYRWADNHNERLPALAAALVHANVAVIVAVGNAQTALAAKSATATIPIVFQNGSDPVSLGLVASLNSPGGNITGITDVTVETAAKRFELACELVPSATAVGYLQNSRNPNADRVVKEIERAGKILGREVIFTNLTSESNLAETFAPLVQRHAGALAVAADPIFTTHRDQLVKLAARHAIPTIFSFREFVVAGGLASYGNDILDVYRHVAGYTARILKGERPIDLPVVQATKYELVLNIKVAKALGLNVPISLLMRVDEVIE